jgi:hypothetical protein
MIVLAGFGAVTTGSTAAYADSQACSGNTCIHLAGSSHGSAFLQAWAYESTFRGHFRLSGPGVTRNSNTQSWIEHKGNYWSTTVANARAGRYCMTAYRDNGGTLGTACQTLL